MKIFKLVLAAVILLAGLMSLNACQTVNSPIENYTWILTSRTYSMETRTPIAGTNMTIYFDSQTKKFNGNSGCNLYSGTYTVDGLTLTIDANISVTVMWCSDEKNEQERQYLEQIKATASFKMDHGNLIIYCGKDTLFFSRRK